MSKMRYKAALAAILLAMTGCATPNLAPASVTPAAAKDAASLNLQLDWGRRVQAVAEDVDQLKVFITPSGGEPIERDFARGQVAAAHGPFVTLDVGNLPGGVAQLRVEAYSQGNLIGQGQAPVGLLVGRRTAAHVAITLSGEGNSDIQPLLPMGDIPNESDEVGPSLP